MKKDIHPNNYRLVVFQDLSNNAMFLTRSTAKSDETVNYEGKEYPLIKTHITSASHPFFTGQEKLIDIEGRVDKFKARAQAAAKAREAANKRGPKVRIRKTEEEKTPEKSEKTTSEK
jgi:large subunit ribosomal protein L31